MPSDLTSQSAPPASQFPIVAEGFEMRPGKGGWKTGTGRLPQIDRRASRLRHQERYRHGMFDTLSDFPVSQLNNVWTDVGTGSFTPDKLFSRANQPEGDPALYADDHQSRRSRPRSDLRGRYDRIRCGTVG